jgi:hypothetical protein
MRTLNRLPWCRRRCVSSTTTLQLMILSKYLSSLAAFSVTFVSMAAECGMFRKVICKGIVMLPPSSPVYALFLSSCFKRNTDFFCCQMKMASLHLPS